MTKDAETKEPLFKASEWTARKRWNQYNSFKLLAHVERWKHIRMGRPVPAPVLVTVDPSNICDLRCSWCNAKYIRDHRNQMLSEKVLCDLADFLPKWGSSGDYEPGVKAVCVAGGGESLLNPSTPSFIDRAVHNGVEVGVVTNGTRINTCIDALCQCTWVGVSVDAASEKTFNKLKGLPEESDTFSRVIDNMAALADYSRRNITKLGENHPSYGVSYKYLLYKDNIGEVYEAAKIAKSIGCKSIHFRPAGTTWDNIGTDSEIRFSDEDIALFDEQIKLAQELDDETFGVFGVTHKFNSHFGISNQFRKCHAVFMTAVVQPPRSADSPKDSFTLGLCCDRRGDDKLELLRDCQDVNEIEGVWGSEKHWQIYSGIDIKTCPRCTYQPHNLIYEEVILNDSMTYKFI
ncbi:MAG: radical SAM protein [Synergistaceae bacterium]|nr:radical SAM protein [Synergistaceae bacterium]